MSESTSSAFARQIEALPGTSSDTYGNRTGSTTLLAPEIETTQTIFRQIAHALTVISGAAELTHDQTDLPAQSIRIWLQPSARQAEDGLRRLRERHLPQTQSLTELIQSLTVLVLAADMIAQGQLSSEVEPESYALMRRNAERAMACIRDLRTHTLE